MDCFAPRATATTVKITPVAVKDFKKWLKSQPKRVAAYIKNTNFSGKSGATSLVRKADGTLDRVIHVVNNRGSLWSFARLPGLLPKGRYQLDPKSSAGMGTAAALGWALASYKYTRYKSNAKKRKVQLVWPEDADRGLVAATAEAAYQGRDLINAPAEDCGPDELAEAVKALAKEHGGKAAVTKGDALLKKNYPAIHAVGRAATRAPLLADLTWGNPKHPKLTLVGKGVVFDSGGLDLKSPQFMKLMKKDMGGAASVIALASMIMDMELPVRLRLLVPSVENAVAGNAYRPGDILNTRKGLTVEVGNTDAEGRIILCDALAEAASEAPDLIIDMATLTGAARVALGAEVPVFFTNDDELAAALADAADHMSEPDPMWRLPLHRPYRRFLDSHIADINNISSTRYGGAITAALFLREFVDKNRWLHVDTMGYNESSRAGRPKGGEVLGVRALYRMLARRYAGQ